jgi:hypothetical protein
VLDISGLVYRRDYLTAIAANLSAAGVRRLRVSAEWNIPRDELADSLKPFAGRVEVVQGVFAPDME